MAASLAALSISLNAGRIDTSNPINCALCIILIILLICIIALSLYAIYFSIKLLKELNDDADVERLEKEISCDDGKIEDTANKILEKLNEKE